MQLDLKDHPGHPRLTYYLGVLQYDLAMELKNAGQLGSLVFSEPNTEYVCAYYTSKFLYTIAGPCV